MSELPAVKVLPPPINPQPTVTNRSLYLGAIPYQTGPAQHGQREPKHALQPDGGRLPGRDPRHRRRPRPGGGDHLQCRRPARRLAQLVPDPVRRLHQGDRHQGAIYRGRLRRRRRPRGEGKSQPAGRRAGDPAAVHPEGRRRRRARPLHPGRRQHDPRRQQGPARPLHRAGQRLPVLHLRLGPAADPAGDLRRSAEARVQG